MEEHLATPTTAASVQALHSINHNEIKQIIHKISISPDWQLELKWTIYELGRGNVLGTAENILVKVRAKFVSGQVHVLSKCIPAVNSVNWSNNYCFPSTGTSGRRVHEITTAVPKQMRQDAGNTTWWGTFHHRVRSVLCWSILWVAGSTESRPDQHIGAGLQVTMVWMNTLAGITVLSPEGVVRKVEPDSAFEHNTSREIHWP